MKLLAALLAISSAATLVMAVASGIETGSLGEYLFGSRNGLLQVARAAVADVGAVILLVAPRRLAGPVAVLTGLAGIALLILAGHAAALDDPVPVVVGIVHVVAVAVWVGGLAGLVLVVFRPALILDGPPPRMREVVPRFSALALVAIGMVAVTGAYEVWAETGQLLPIGTDVRSDAAHQDVTCARRVRDRRAQLFRRWAHASLARRLPDPGRRRVDDRRRGPRPRGGPGGHAAGRTRRGWRSRRSPTRSGRSPRTWRWIVPGRPGVNRIVVTATDALVSLDLRLSLDQLDAGTSSTVPLVPRGLEGMAGMEGMEHGSDVTRNEDGTIDWTAERVILPAASSWNATVQASSTDGAELARQRFVFALDDEGIAAGEVTTLLNPGAAIALVLLAGGALGLGLGIGGFVLPRCDVAASRPALLGRWDDGGRPRHRDRAPGAPRVTRCVGTIRLPRSSIHDLPDDPPRHPPAPDARPAHQRHRPVQLPLWLLHAARGVRADHAFLPRARSWTSTRSSASSARRSRSVSGRSGSPAASRSCVAGSRASSRAWRRWTASRT